MNDEQMLHLNAIKRELMACVKELSPEPTIKFRDERLEYSYKAKEYVLHTRSKSRQTTQNTFSEVGPSPEGFVLTLSIDTKDHPIYQAVVPQTIKEEYWSVFINEYPVKDSPFVVFLSYKYGEKMKMELLADIINTVKKYCDKGK